MAHDRQMLEHTEVTTLEPGRLVRGRVVGWNLEQHFGFVSVDAAEDVFVHATQLVGVGWLKKGEWVELCVGRRLNGRRFGVGVYVVPGP